MDKDGKDKDVSLDAYEALETIGSGSYGRVVRVRRKSDGRLLVWKEVNYGRMSDKEKQLIVSEVNLLREFRHPNIVRYHDRIIARETRRLYIVMEYCQGGDLAQVIKARKRAARPLEESQIWQILLQLCLALRECHCRKQGKVLHRDIKPANVLLSGGGDLHVKLGDFGLARILSENSRFAYTNVGTPYYMAPEQVDELPYDEKCDIWSLGCVIYELCMLHPPFEASNQLSLATKIKEASPEPCHSYSPELCAIIERLLVKDRTSRPSIEELLELPAISLRLKERKVAEALVSLKRKEDELRRWSDELKAKELALVERERVVAEQERRSNGCCLCSPPAGCVSPAALLFGRISPPCLKADLTSPTGNSAPQTISRQKAALPKNRRDPSPKATSSPGHSSMGAELGTPAVHLSPPTIDSLPEASPGYLAEDRASPRAGVDGQQDPSDPADRACGACRPPIPRKQHSSCPSGQAAPPSRHRGHAGRVKAGSSMKAGSSGGPDPVAAPEDQTSLYKAFKVAR
eukprot:GGOE01003837.1.p1 GENE.GGOE01003837.1~~GGOE01003837.1.p1  ORF type:complete len:549 (+),score=94.59 GGOE01003837.1:92-1648(+)